MGKHHDDIAEGGRMPPSSGARRIALTGLLFALMLVLSVVENSIPLPMPVPGVRLGLANIVVMYSLFFMNRSTAVQLAILKAGFAFLTRGAVAAFLSLCGGLLSVLVMVLLFALWKEKLSVFMASVVGAVFHNVGQLLGASAVYTNLFLWAYLPVLLVAGIAAGAATSTLLRVTLPALKRLDLSNKL